MLGSGTNCCRGSTSIAHTSMPSPSLGTRSQSQASTMQRTRAARAPQESAQQIRDALGHPAIQAAADSSEQLKIMYDGLEAAYSRVAEATQVQVTPTTVSRDGLSTYASEDGTTTIRFLVNTGQKVDWLVTSASSLARLLSLLSDEYRAPVSDPGALAAKTGGGLARMTGYSPADSDVPHLHYELGLTFGQVTLYFNLASRVNLLLDDAYFNKYFQTATPAGPSLADLELQLQQADGFSPFRSKSADIRMMTGPTALLYSAPGTAENMRTAVELGRQVTDAWLHFLAQPADALSEAKRQEVAAHDAVHYGFQRKDPGNAIIVGLLGAETTEEILKLSTRDAAILA